MPRFFAGRSKFFPMLVVLCSFCPGLAHPQTAAAPAESSPVVSGFVTGLVIAEETRQPVRFAEINIVPVPVKELSSVSGGPPSAAVAPPDRSHTVQRINGTADMDGRFHMKVPVGDYFVAALKPGYVDPAKDAAMDYSLTEAQVEAAVASVQQVHVGAGGSAGVNLVLHRGAVLTGRMRFEDGSPAIRVPVSCELIDSITRREAAFLPENRGKVASPLQQALVSLFVSQHAQERLTTDDEGRYRISGLSPGKYIVSTMLGLDHGQGRIAMMDGSSPDAGSFQPLYPEMIPVYAPASFRRSDARVFDLHGEEQIADADLTIDPHGLHTLRGRVLAATDHRAPRTILLLKEGEHGDPRLLESENDGRFQATYLPSGSYTLQISATAIPESPGTVSPAQYKGIRLSVVVADQDVDLGDVFVVLLKQGEKQDPDSFPF